MFVRNDQSIDVADVPAVGGQSLVSLFSADSGVEQETKSVRFDVDAVSIADGLEGDHFHGSIVAGGTPSFIEEARKGLDEGGIPIGSVLVIDGQIVGRGHNRRVQKGSAILHAEMDAVENAGRIKTIDYRRAVLYSTLSPCDMCSGMACFTAFLGSSLEKTRHFVVPRITFGREVSLSKSLTTRCV